MIDYLSRLQQVIKSNLICVPKVTGGLYEIKESAQEPFLLDPKNIPDVLVMDLQKIRGDWPCFHAPHSYAHRRCDKIAVAWSKRKKAPVYLLFEMKSEQTAGAWTQLQASMAFCQFLHSMALVNVEIEVASPLFGAITLRNFPIVQKQFAFQGQPVPAWKKAPYRSHCWRLTAHRKPNEMRLKWLLDSLELQV